MYEQVDHGQDWNKLQQITATKVHYGSYSLRQCHYGSEYHSHSLFATVATLGCQYLQTISCLLLPRTVPARSEPSDIMNTLKTATKKRCRYNQSMKKAIHALEKEMEALQTCTLQHELLVAREQVGHPASAISAPCSGASLCTHTHMLSPAPKSCTC